MAPGAIEFARMPRSPNSYAIRSEAGIGSHAGRGLARCSVCHIHHVAAICHQRQERMSEKELALEMDFIETIKLFPGHCGILVEQTIVGIVDEAIER